MQARRQFRGSIPCDEGPLTHAPEPPARRDRGGRATRKLFRLWGMCAARQGCCPGTRRRRIHPSPGELVRVFGNRPDGLVEFRRSCPGISVTAQRPVDATRHDFLGPIVSIWEAYAFDEDIRFAGSSGGTLTALNEWLLATGQIDSVVVAAASESVPRGPNRARFGRDRMSSGPPVPGMHPPRMRRWPTSTIQGQPSSGSPAR